MKGVIFDMDGTMVDNMLVHHEAWRKNMADHGITMTLEEIKEKVHGINEEILERLFGDRFTKEERKLISGRKEEIYREIFSPRLRLIEGLDQWLDDLENAGIPMAIGTAAPPDNVDFVVDRLGLRSRFQSIMHAKSVDRGKPDPEIFIRSAEAIGLPIEECLVFEDSVTGAQASYHAKAPTIIVTTTHTEEEFTGFDHILAFISDYRDPLIETLRKTLPHPDNHL